jgi:alpha-1,3-rhamnosyl/mannosyltransferase
MDVLPCTLPTVATIHDVNPLLEDGRGWFARWTRRRKFHRLLREAKPQVGAYATDTEDARGRIVSFFPELRSALGVVPLYVESSFTAPSAARVSEVLARHGLPKGYFLFVGSLRRHKNWEGLIRAFARLPEALRRERPLVLVGPAHRAQTEVHRLTQRLGVSGEVRCTGAVEDTDLPALYTGARGFVFPSFLEGFGLPPLEAMALGVPVISSNRTCLPEVLGDAPLYIDPADHAALAAAMEQLAGDETLHARLAEAGLARSRVFNAARTAEAMGTLLGRLLASPPNSR